MNMAELNLAMPSPSRSFTGRERCQVRFQIKLHENAVRSEVKDLARSASPLARSSES
jgi:hypothetical protein